MEIPVGVDVICGTAVCGRSKYLVINPVNDQVTHLVVAEKLPPHTERLVPLDYVWGHKDVTIPVSQIEKIADGVVHLKLDKQTVATLPGTPIHRKWK